MAGKRDAYIDDPRRDQADPVITLVSTGGHRLPPWLDPDYTSTDYLDRVTSTIVERTATIARPGTELAHIYGREKVGARIARIKAYNGKTLVVAVWGQGPCSAKVKVLVGGEEFTGGTHYLGVSGQTPDPTVLAAFGQADDLDEVCYSVLEIPLDKSLDIAAIWDGYELYDPRTGLTAWSRNPALVLAHFVDNFTDYEINWASVEGAADYCDEALADGPRWEIDLAFTKAADVDDVIATLRDYANCFIYMDAGEMHLVPDAPRAVDHIIDSSMMAPLPSPLRKQRMRDVPTQVVCEYTAIHNDDYFSNETPTPDPPAGTPLRLTRLRMSGFRKASMAYRKALETLNKATLSDLSADIQLFDYGLKVTAGDVMTFTSTLGVTAKPMRVHYNYPNAKGRWRARIQEYDPAGYADTVITEPTFVDTELSSPTVIPDGPVPEVVDKNYTDEMGHTYSILSISFTGVAWSWTSGYRVKVSSGSFVVMETTVASQGEILHTVPTPAVSQGTLYNIEVWVLNGLGGMSTNPGTAQKQADGKALPPSNVPAGTLVGVEASLFVSLTWSAATDSDLKGYLIKRLSKADWESVSTDDERWNHANVVLISERNDLTSALIPNQPVGDFYYGVKAIDKVYPKAGHESVLARWTFVPVTADAAGAVALKQLSVAFTELTWDSIEVTFDSIVADFSGALPESGSLLNMHIYEIYGDGTFAVTSGGDTWADRFGIAGTSWDTNVSAGERWGGDLNLASEIFTETWDTAADRAASWNWLGEIEHWGGGTLSYYVGLAKEATPTTWVDHPGNAVNAEGRYMRAVIKSTAALGDGFRVRLPINATFQGKIKEFSEQESVPLTPQPLSIVFPTTYGGTPKVTTQLLGSTAGFALPDNISSAGFDIYVFDATGAPMAGTVDWQSIGT